LYFGVGKDKFLEELDLINIIKTMRKVKILTQVLLSNKQKYLLKFQKNNVIDSTSSGTSDEEIENIAKILEGDDEK
jgi:hypothetical protein